MANLTDQLKETEESKIIDIIFQTSMTALRIEGHECISPGADFIDIGDFRLTVRRKKKK